MSVLTFRDQNGAAVWGLATRIARGHGDTTKAEDERYPDKAGTTAFVGVKLVLPSDDGHTVHVNYNEGLNPGWASYTPVSQHFPDIEAIPSGYTITVQKSGGPNPPDPPPSGQLTTFSHPQNASVKGYGTSDEWKKLAHDFVNKSFPNGLMEPLNGPQPNLAAFNRFLQSVTVPSGFTRCELQNADRGEGALKPRLFMPTSDTSQNDATGKYSRIIDFGDFGFKFFHNAVSSDEWVRTPPSW